MRAAATLLVVIVVAVVVASFSIFAIARALDYESHCVQASGQCETP